MTEPQRRLMTPEEFFAWQLDQEERYELVDGVPGPLRGMTGASNAHDAVAVNIIISLRHAAARRAVPGRQRRHGGAHFDPRYPSAGRHRGMRSD